MNEVASDATEEREFKLVHLNLKKDYGLSPEYNHSIDTEAVNHTVFAQYEDHVVMRTNRQWVDVGIWTSLSIDADMVIQSGDFYFNVWFQVNQSDYNANPDWEFTFYRNDELLINVSDSSERESREHPEETIVIAHLDSQITLSKGDIVALKIRYRAWEDCSLYYDNMSLDSGALGNMNSIFIHDAGGKEVNARFLDAWGIDWNDEGKYICSVEMMGETYPGNNDTVITAGGLLYDGDGKYFNLTRIRFVGIEAGENEEVVVTISYGPEVTSEGWTYTYENLVPTIQLEKPENDAILNTTEIDFRFTLEDNEPLTFEIFLDTNPEPAISLTGPMQYNDTIIPNVIRLTLNEGRTYYWKIVVTDGTYTNESEVRSFYVQDNTPPVINHTGYSKKGKDGEEIHISVEVTDNETFVELVSIYYRKNAWDVAKYKKIVMQKDGDYYNATIPDDDVTQDGIEYYIEATDGRNTITNPMDTETPYVIRVEGKDDGGLLPGFEIMSVVTVVTTFTIVKNRKRMRRE